MTIWNNDEPLRMWNRESDFKVIEEKWFEKDIYKCNEKRERITLSGVLSVYKNLRVNYELRGRYYEAGKFIIRAMEINRKYAENHYIDNSLHPIKRRIGSKEIFFHQLDGITFYRTMVKVYGDQLL